jgi:MFS family permease
MFLINALPAEDFLAWGWRYPFFVAFAINVVALFARLRIVVTPEYDAMFQDRELQAAPISETIRTNWKVIVFGAFAPLASFAMFHMVTVYPLSWVYLFTDESPSRFLAIEAIAAGFGLVAIIASGYLADRLGRRTVLGATAAAIAVFSAFAPTLLGSGESGEVVFMIAGFIILGLSFGQSSGALSHNFLQRHRYTGSALTSDLAWLFGAGFAPFIALWLSSQFGLLAAGGYLLSGAVGTLIALWLNRSLASTID